MSADASLALARMDRVGTSLSVACAIQCMAVPLLLSVLPLSRLRPLMLDAVETLFVIASVGLAVASHCWGFRIHRKTVVTLRDSLGQERRRRLFGSTIEMGGRVKVFSYILD